MDFDLLFLSAEVLADSAFDHFVLLLFLLLEFVEESSPLVLGLLLLFHLLSLAFVDLLASQLACLLLVVAALHGLRLF